ncbi:MAG: hypothetical protein H0W82_01460 [Actinobacteria bacterium]|nr:hypothetical protein [Actinomycetota bacterium]
MPTSAVKQVTRTITIAAGAGFPPAPGEQVATMEVAIPGLRLGAVPLLAGDPPPPPDLTDAGPWWQRAAGTVVRAATATIRATIS